MGKLSICFRCLSKQKKVKNENLKLIKRKKKRERERDEEDLKPETIPGMLPDHLQQDVK